MEEQAKKIEKRLNNLIEKKLMCNKNNNIEVFINETIEEIIEKFTENEKTVILNCFANLRNYIKDYVVKFYAELKTHTIDEDLKTEKTKEILQEKKEQTLDDIILILHNEDLRNYFDKNISTKLLATFLQDEIILDCHSKNWKKSSKILNKKATKAVIDNAFICSSGLISFHVVPIDNKSFLFEYKVNRNLLNNAIIEKLNRENGTNIELNTSQPIPIIDLNPDATTEQREEEEEEIIKKWIDEDLKRC